MLVRRSHSVYWLLVVAAYCLVSVRSQACIGGPHHYKTAQAAGADFGGACANYKTKTCCRGNTSENIDSYVAKQIHRFHHDDCGKLSDNCAKYIKAQVCFYDCDPYVKPWEVAPGILSKTPICKSDCEDAFEACKDDKTCVSDYSAAVGQAYRSNSDYHCPGFGTDNLTCKTFADMYGSAKKMCETQWPSVYTDDPNCLSNTFSISKSKLNPNACVKPKGQTEVNKADCDAYRLQSVGSTHRLQTVHLALLVSAVSLLSLWLGPC